MGYRDTYIPQYYETIDERSKVKCEVPTGNIQNENQDNMSMKSITPLNLNFYIAKLGCEGVYNFSHFYSKTLWVLIRTASMLTVNMYPQSIFLVKILKKITEISYFYSQKILLNCIGKYL